MQTTAYLYAFDTMADWEIGYLTAELRTGRYYRKGQAPTKVVTVGIGKTPVTTMGGLTILPELALDECVFASSDLLILPGGETWTEAVHDPVLDVVERCLREGVRVAAICGATVGLARRGALDSRRHTSNDLTYLRMTCPAYAGGDKYIAELAVTDGNLITASGVAPLEFSAHVLRALDVFSPEALDAWYSLNKTHEPEHFYGLMNAIQ